MAQPDPMSADTSEDGNAMLLVFRLEAEAFAVTVNHVHEILDPQTPTPVPNADPVAPGLINVRGVVVSVLDIRRRLGLPPAQALETTRMIVLEHDIEGNTCKIAFSADSVEEVREADLTTLEKVPDLGASWPQVYLRGALRREDDLIILLETNTLFAPSTPPVAA